MVGSFTLGLKNTLTISHFQVYLHPRGELLEVTFGSNALRKAFEDSSQANRRWGAEVGRTYIQRVEALYASESFEVIRSIRAFRVHELHGEKKGEWSIHLTRRARLIVVPSRDQKSVVVQEVSQHYGD